MPKQKEGTNQGFIPDSYSTPENTDRPFSTVARKSYIPNNDPISTSIKQTGPTKPNSALIPPHLPNPFMNMSSPSASASISTPSIPGIVFSTHSIHQAGGVPTSSIERTSYPNQLNSHSNGNSSGGNSNGKGNPFISTQIDPNSAHLKTPLVSSTVPSPYINSGNNNGNGNVGNNNSAVCSMTGCECSDFTPHSFKPGVCNTCFHKH